ncbi:signal peptidase I [Nocardioides sp. LHG3406-4]|uniref:signal peptidase I n=1 Tax=Nocardioides sp. LHG3406-4 TaxID=2804575 RepID=UPI003CF03E09
MTSDDRASTSTADGEEGSRSSTPTPAAPATRKRKPLPLWQETILLLVVALVLAVLIKALFVQAFYIPSESMEPGLVKNDRILVQKVSYWGGGGPERGDVVVFKDPGGWLGPLDDAGPTSALTKVMSKIGLYPTGGHLVKRVIGVEGDVIKCCDARGRISVNGVPLNENDYVKQDGQECRGPMPTQCGDDWEAGPVPKGHIFVMGDNRGASADSSEHMCPQTVTDCVPGDEFVSADLVVGKVFVLLWPRDHFQWVKRPATFADVGASP